MPLAPNHAKDHVTGLTSRRSRPARSRWLKLAFRLASVALVGYLLVRLALDFWPVSEMDEIRATVARGRTGEAITALEWRLRKHPLDGEARLLIARLLASREEFLDAAEQLRRVPPWWPGRRSASFYEAEAFEKAGRSREAEGAYRDVVAYDPLHPVPWEQVRGATKWLVAHYLAEERRQDAREVLEMAYREAEDVSPGDRLGILRTRLQVELLRIEPEEAIRSLEQLVERDPADLAARRGLALALQAAGRPDEAGREIRRCLSLDPISLENWKARLSILRERNDPAALAKAVASMPRAAAEADDAAIRLAIGIAAEERGDLDGAMAAYEAATQFDPHETEAHYRLSLLAQRLGDQETAEIHGQRHKQLMDAKKALPAAYNRFLDATDPRGYSPPKAIAPVAGELATIAETLGWPWLADRLKELPTAITLP